MNTEIQKQLTALALNRSKPFCYSCYIECPNACCPKCASDDLMRLVPGIGCEFGCDWIIQHILNTELEPVCMDQVFEDNIRECYPKTTQVGWLEIDTVTVLKEMDPVSWRCAQADWESTEVSDGNILTFDNGITYYYQHDIESLLE